MQTDEIAWLGIAASAVATFFAVLLAFWLDRVVERRRADAVAFWLARHWVRSTARAATSSVTFNVVRRLTHGKSAPTLGEVQRAMVETDPMVATWWNRVSLGMAVAGFGKKDRDDQRYVVTHAAERIEAELQRATQRWPPRWWRLRRLARSLPDLRMPMEGTENVPDSVIYRDL